MSDGLCMKTPYRAGGRQQHKLISRRSMLCRSAAVTASLALDSSSVSLLGAPESRRFKIGACDWSIGKMGDPAAFKVAKEIGLDGVQVSLGTAANNMRLRKPEAQQEYKEAAGKEGLAVASLAIGELNEIPY